MNELINTDKLQNELCNNSPTNFFSDSRKKKVSKSTLDINEDCNISNNKRLKVYHDDPSASKMPYDDLPPNNNSKNGNDQGILYYILFW